MNVKRELKKEAYRRIIKENQPHQQAYAEMLSKSPKAGDLLVEELAKYPNEKKREAKRSLIVTYVVLLAAIVLMRIIAFIITPELLRLPALVVLLAVLFTMVVPVIGIVMALTHRIDGYRTVAMLFILSIVRSLKYLTGDPLELIGFVPLGAAIILAFIIPSQLKVSYKKHIVKPEAGSDGKITTQVVFDETVTNYSSEDLLDTKI